MTKPLPDFVILIRAKRNAKSAPKLSGVTCWLLSSGNLEKTEFPYLSWVFRLLHSSVWSAVLLLTALCVAQTPPPDAKALARAIDSHYNHLHTLLSDFTEIYSGAGGERTETGTLRLKKPGKMRWEYRSPKEKLFVGDGKEAWFFIPGEQHARTVSMDKLEDLRSPLAFLLGKTRLQKELNGLVIATDEQPWKGGDVILRGSPASMADRITFVRLEVTSDHQIARLVLDGIDGSVTEFRFDNQKENAEIPEKQFHFSPPPGVDVVEGDFAQ